MLQYLIRRVLYAVPIALAVSLVCSCWCTSRLAIR